LPHLPEKTREKINLYKEEKQTTINGISSKNNVGTKTKNNLPTYHGKCLDSTSRKKEECLGSIYKNQPVMVQCLQSKKQEKQSTCAEPQSYIAPPSEMQQLTRQCSTKQKQQPTYL